MKYKNFSSIMRFLPSSIFLFTLIAIVVFHQYAKGVWERIDGEKDLLAKEIRSSINLIISDEKKCQQLVPFLNGEKGTILLDQFLFPSSFPFKGYFIDLLPFELISKDKGTVLLRYNFNVKERLQYSNWYLVLVELAVTQNKGEITSCHMTREINGDEGAFYPQMPN